MSHARASGLTDAHGRDVTLKLQSLMRAGLLMASGSGNQKTYALTAPAGAKEPREADSSSEQSSEQSAPEEVSGSSWAAKERVESAILTFCRGTWRTLPEIAKAVGRAESCPAPCSHASSRSCFALQDCNFSGPLGDNSPGTSNASHFHSPPQIAEVKSRLFN